MIKRLIGIILSLCLLISVVDINVLATETEGPKEVTLSMYSNLSKDTSISGLYDGNVFYIPLEKLCDLVEGEIISQSDKEATLNVGIREFAFDVGSNNMVEKLYSTNNNVKMPSMFLDNQIYISALHFLTYIGATVHIDEQADVQFMVFKRYDIFNALVDMANKGSGHFFWWDEFDIEFEDLKDKIVNAGIVALINRESNVFRMMFDAKGMEQEAVEEALLMIVKNEGTEYFDENSEKSEIVGLENDFIGAEAEWFGLIKDAYQDTSDLGKQISDLADYSAVVAGYTTNIVEAIESLKQFNNISVTQKDLLANTIIKNSSDSKTLNDQWKVVLKAAENINKKIQSEHTKQIDLATQSVEAAAYDLINGVAGTESNPVSIAWDSAVLLTKLIPATKEMIDKKALLYNAYNTSIIQLIANEMLVDAYSDWYYRRYNNAKEQLTAIKQLMVLQLKSTLTTREYLIESGFVEEDYVNRTKEMNKEIAILLNNVENCFVPNANMYSVEYDGDLTWMENNTSETNETSVRLLSKDPFEDNKSLFDVYEYDITGGIKENKGKYNTFTILPSDLVTVTIPDAFMYKGKLEPLTIELEEARGGRDAQIMLKFGAINDYGYGSVKNYGTGVGYEWDGESIFCYFCRGENSDYFVIEKIIPTSSTVGTEFFNIGQDDGERVESIIIMDLNSSTEKEYELRYRDGGFTIKEEIRNSKDNTSQSQWIYYQNGPRLIFDYGESLCKSYDEAMEYIKAELSEYNLDSRIIGESGTEPKIVPVFIEHRDGIKQEISLESIEGVELKDKLYWGINNQYSNGEIDSSVQESIEPNSILGVWDSYDGETRLIFESTGNDFAVTNEGLEDANGTVQIINYITGEKEYASYILDENYITLVHDLDKYKLTFSFDTDSMLIHEDYYYKIEDILVNQLIGRWENDELKIQFIDQDDVEFYDKTGYRNRSSVNGIYAVLNESELWLNLENDGIGTIKYSVDGNVLNLNGTILFNNGVDASYNSIINEKLIGTWQNEGDIADSYYVFKEDGCYEYYVTEQSYLVGLPMEEGTYEIINVDKLRLYANDYRFAFEELEYSTDEVLKNSSGQEYIKVK